MFPKCTLSFESLPFWQGTLEKREKPVCFPFEVSETGFGYIAQTTSAEVQEKIIANYSDDDYGFITLPPGCSDWANELGDMMYRYIARCIRRVNPRKLCMMEVGAGTLYIAKKLCRRFPVDSYLAVDPAIRETSTREEIKVFRKYFDYPSFKDSKTNFLISLNCLEHIPQPETFMEDVRKLLVHRNGYAVLIFPDCGPQFRWGDPNVFVHEHMNYFTLSSARRFFHKLGFEIIDASVKWDCLCFFVRPAGKQMLKNENSELKDLCLLEKTSLQLRKNLVLSSEFIRNLLERDKLVGIHGACSGVDVYLHLTGLGREKNLWVFDGDTSKSERFLPSCRNPIRHSLDPFYKEIDTVLIGASTFSRQIRNYLQDRMKFSPHKILRLFPFSTVAPRPRVYNRRDS